MSFRPEAERSALLDRRAGFTLSEVMVAMGLWSIVSIGLLGMIVMTWNSYLYNRDISENASNSSEAMYTLIHGGRGSMWGMKQAYAGTFSVTTNLVDGSWEARYQCFVPTNAVEMVTGWNARTKEITNNVYGVGGVPGVIAENIVSSRCELVQNGSFSNYIEIAILTESDNMKLEDIIETRIYFRNTEN